MNHLLTTWRKGQKDNFYLWRGPTPINWNTHLYQWAETARVRHMTLPISRCPNVQRLREFTVWLCQFLGVLMSGDCKSLLFDHCQFLGVPISGDYESLPFDFNNLSVKSGDCESSLFDFANFSVSQWAETARVRRLTLPISPCPNGRILREFLFWFCQFIGVPSGRDCRICHLTLPISPCPNGRRLREFAISCSCSVHPPKPLQRRQLRQ